MKKFSLRGKKENILTKRKKDRKYLLIKNEEHLIISVSLILHSKILTFNITNS